MSDEMRELCVVCGELGHTGCAEKATQASAKRIAALECENARYGTALKDIAYAKSWIVQRKPMNLVSIALEALSPNSSVKGE